jgi:hypothetical protein
MSIRFAAAGRGGCVAVARVLRSLRPNTPANDTDNGLAQDLMLQSALRHFSRHGLAAAEQARTIAMRAIAEGDRGQYSHWLAICGKLDRRMASRLSATYGSGEA